MVSQKKSTTQYLIKDVLIKTFLMFGHELV